MQVTLRKFINAALVLLLALGAASHTLAQSTGSIRGTVTDSSGSIIPNASLTLTETSTDLSRHEVSNSSGIFVFADLPIGNYTLEVAAPGFQTQKRPALTLLTGQVIGLPITILSGVDNSISGVGNDFGNYVAGVSPARPAGVSKIKEWFNPAAFAENPIGTFGNVPRNSLRGPGYDDVDLSLFKDIAATRRVHAQFQAEAFNSLNHTNLSNPVSTVSSGTFGQITATSSSTGSVNIPSVVGSPRVFQFGLKVIF